MNLQKLINSRAGILAVMRLGRVLPPRIGYGLADLVAGFLSRRRNFAPVRAVRANQWVVHGCQATAGQLDILARETYRSAGRCIYDFYHLLSDNEALKSRVRLEPSFEALFQQTLRKETGTILCLPHIGNFDMVGRALALHGMRFQAITPPVELGFEGYQLQNRLRGEVGMELTPASMEAVRKATQCLRENGTVVLGVDRPLPGSNHSPRFFNLPASLPTAHIRLGLRLQLPLYVVGLAQNGLQDFRVWAQGPISLQACQDPDEEILLNSERILKIVEENILQYPVQWNMTHPVWPQILNEAP